MAKLRKGIAYRRLERPYTRRSKYRSKNYVRANPHNLVVKFEAGDPKGDFEKTFYLISKDDVQIRHNALESARKSLNRLLEKKLGRKGFFFRYRVYPHHILRENPLATGAGADRMSTGMKMSFGKPIGLAAQVKKGKIIMELRVNNKDSLLAREAFRRAATKFPCRCSVEEEVLTSLPN